MPTNDNTRDLSINGPTRTHAAGPQHTVGHTPEQVDAQARVAASRFPQVRGYSIQRELGEGGMAVVYAAREVAIKVMKPGHSTSRFVVEAQITAKLPHPNIPPVHALGTLADGRPYLVMKLVSGQTLANVLAGTEPGDRPRLLGYFEGICQAVGFAHARGLIHRDLKPSNVMVGAFGEVQVMDWGLAKDAGTSDAPTASTHGAAATMATLAGDVKGTPAYMAPEQARGEKVDAQADVFALGGILATILTGRPPFAGSSVMDTVIRAAQAELADIFKHLNASGADRELIVLAKQCLAPQAKDRPADGNAVAKAVAAYRTKVEERLRRAERERAAAQARMEEAANTQREAEARAEAEFAQLAELRRRRRSQRILEGTFAVLGLVVALGIVIAMLWRTAAANRAQAILQTDIADSARDDAIAQKGIADQAKDDALRQKLAAERAKEEAIQQKRLADQTREKEVAAAVAAAGAARQKAEREIEILAALEYGRTIQLAHRECLDSNSAGVRALLDGTRDNLRGWEWHY